MSKDKLNKIAHLYTSALSGGVKRRDTDAEKELKEGPEAEMEETPAEQAKEDREGTERHPAAARDAKRSKKLDFNEGRGGMRSTIYKDKE